MTYIAHRFEIFIHAVRKEKLINDKKLYIYDTVVLDIALIISKR